MNNTKKDKKDKKDSKDSLGDRMKKYEGVEANRKFLPLLPIMTRIDGRNFHSFTKGLKRPYDERLSTAMENTTKRLVEETNACMGYTQSDEITLVWHSTNHTSKIWFDGRIQKMTSQLGALSTLYFYIEVQKLIPEKKSALPSFDARVWQLPNQEEAVNAFLWREMDATKNSISMAAAANYSPKELHKKNSREKQEMLHQKGTNWNEYPVFFKRGVYIQRRKTIKPFTSQEIEDLPLKHEARKNPNLKIERKEIRTIDMPPLKQVINKIEVIFNGEDPLKSL